MDIINNLNDNIKTSHITLKTNFLKDKTIKVSNSRNSTKMSGSYQSKQAD